MNMTSRRISLPVLRRYSPNRLSPQRFGYLKDISEFEIEAPFISNNGSSSSSCEASPKRMLSPLRPASARPYRRRRKLERESWATSAFDCEDEDDIFGANAAHSSSHSPSPQPTYSLRCSPQPLNTASSNSTTSMVNDFLSSNDENLSDSGKNLFIEKYYVEPPQSTDQTLKQANQQMRSFNIDTRGRIVDCGFKSGRQSRPLTRSNKNRRATCPEIWLSSADEEVRPITRCVLRIYGSSNVGKKAMITQMTTHADINHQDLNLDYDEVNVPNSNTIGFMMNDEEVQLEIVHGSAPESDGLMTIYMVIYSVDNRDSFVRAAQILYRLHDSRRLAPGTPVILVANKIDLQRKRKVTFIEGKMLAKIYKSAFVETSSLLSMNMDRVWEETLKKFQKYKASRERQLRALKGTLAPKHSPNCLMGKIVKQGRRFAKSCEEIVAKLAAL